jgi:signal transduction histidine kinase
MLSRIDHQSASRYIAIRLIAVVLITSVLVMGLFALHEYHDRYDRLNSEVTRIEKTAVPLLTKSLWSYDLSMINTQLAGLSQDPHVVYARVLDHDVIIADSGKNIENIDQFEKKRYELVFIKDEDAQRVAVGTLELFLDYKVIFLESVSETMPIFIVIAVVISIMGLTFFCLFEREISFNLMHMSKYLHQLTASNMDEEYKLPKAGKSKTEFIRMSDAINTMRNDLVEAQKAQARQMEHLEEMVEARTGQLRSSRDETLAAFETLKRMQSEVIRSEKMAALGSLVAGVAHELNTPIGNAVITASTLSDSYGSMRNSMLGSIKKSDLNYFMDTVGDSCDILVRNLDRAANLISSFKQVAVDQSSYQKRRFDLRELVEEIVLTLSPSLKHSNVRITNNIPQEIVMNSFPGPLGQIIINLIQNAKIHAYDAGVDGVVNVVAKKSGNNMIELCVIDDGKGISGDHIKKIFDPFFTTKLGSGGSGLGLSIAYSLVTDILLGTINVSSQLGSGTEFKLQLPLSVESYQTNS